MGRKSNRFSPEVRESAKRADEQGTQIPIGWLANTQGYGADKVWHQMNIEGAQVPRGRVERLMNRLRVSSNSGRFNHAKRVCSVSRKGCSPGQDACGGFFGRLNRSSRAWTPVGASVIETPPRQSCAACGCAVVRVRRCAARSRRGCRFAGVG